MGLGDNVTQLFFDLLGRTQGEDDLERFGKTLDKTGDAAARSSKKYDTLAQGTKRLGANLDEATEHVKKLREEFQRTGDVSLLKDISKGEKDIKRLQGWIKSFGDDSDHSARKVGLLNKAIAGSGDAAGALAKTFSGGASNPYVIMAAGAAAATVAVPALAAAGGAALAGLGAGFIGLGAVGQKNSALVQGAVEQLGNTTSSTLTAASSVLEGRFVGALHQLEGTAESTRPALTRMFSDVAPSVTALAGGVDGFVQNSLPGLERGIEGSSDAVGILAGKLPELGAAFSDALSRIGQESEGGAKALGTLLDVVNIGIESAGKTVAGAEKAWNWITKIPGNDRILGSIAAMAGLDSGARSAATSTEHLSIATSVAIAQFENLTRAEMAASQSALALSGSADAVSSGFYRIGDAVKHNGVSLTGFSQKAIENRNVLRQSIGDILSHAAATAKDSSNTGQATMQRDRELRRLRDVAVARGMDRRAVEEFIATAARVPRSVFTDVKERGAAAAAEHLRSVARAETAIARAVQINVGVSGYSAAMANLNQLSARARAGVGGQATGGPVRGPGSSTSDSIPAMLSDGEYVIKASSARKIGYGTLDRLNAIGMASGGRVAAINEIAAAIRSGRTIYEDLSFRGMSANAARYNDSISWSEVRGVASRGAGGKQGAMAFPRLSTLPTSGKEIWSAADRLAKLVKGAFSGQKEGSLLSLITRDSQALSGLANQRMSVVKRLGSAQKQLSDLTKASIDRKADTVSKVMGTFSLTGGPQGENATGIIGRLGASVAGARTFADRIGALRKRGLASGLLAQLADAGPEGGNAAALALLHASGGEFGQVNALYGQLGGAANSAGLSTSEALYGAGIRAAQGLVKGLSSQQKAIEAQMIAIATAMQTAIKRALGIHSPSAVMAGLGAQVPAGFAKGIAGGHGQVATAAERMAMAAARGAGTGAGSGAGGGLTIHNLNVHPPAGVNARQFGAELLEYLWAVQKGGGRVPWVKATG